MDGYFLDLDVEVVEGEVDEYMRDLFKVQKVFNNKYKKILAEWDEEQRVKKRERQKLLLTVSLKGGEGVFITTSPFNQSFHCHCHHSH